MSRIALHQICGLARGVVTWSVSSLIGLQCYLRVRLKIGKRKRREKRRTMRFNKSSNFVCYVGEESG